MDEVWAKYHGPMEPVHPCREMPTRHCPASYDAVCGERPCARFESTDPEPWQVDVSADAIRDALSGGNIITVNKVNDHTRLHIEFEGTP